MSTEESAPPLRVISGKSNGKGPPAPQPFDFKALDELTVSQDGDIVQHVYGTQNLIAVVGAPNASKTAFGIDHGLHIAAGSTWFTQKVRGGPVLYIAPEAPGSVIMRAKAAAARKFPGRRLPFYVVQGVPELGGEARSVLDTKRILDTIDAIKSLEGAEVKLVQIDTLASCLGDGDENGDGMLRLVAAAKTIAIRAGCAVMLIHHPSKGDGATSPRGHGSLIAACDAIVTITVDEPTGIRSATLTKSRDAATGLKFVYALETVTLEERDSFGDARTTILVKPMDAHDAPRKRPAGRSQDQLLIELERRHRTGETGWDRATVHRAGKDLGMHRNSAATACKGLINAGFLIGTDARLTLKDPPEERCT